MQGRFVAKTPMPVMFYQCHKWRIATYCVGLRTYCEVPGWRIATLLGHIAGPPGHPKRQKKRCIGQVSGHPLTFCLPADSNWLRENVYLLETTEKLYVLPQESAPSVGPAPSEMLSLDAGPATALPAEPSLARDQQATTPHAVPDAPRLDAFRMLQNRMRGEREG